MMKRIALILVMAVFGGVLVTQGADQGSQVAVVYNSRVPESRDVAEHYAAMRHVPSSQVFGFDMPEVEIISRSDFRERLQKPILKKLESRGLFHFETRTVAATATEPRHSERKLTRASIRYLVLCYGVPLLIIKDADLREPGAASLPEAFQRNEAAVDSELACLPVIDHMMLAGPRQNPFFGCTNEQFLNPTNGVLMVSRLDGPSAVIARALVDKAIEAETNGLWGRAYFDLRGLTNGPYKPGDDWIREAAEICQTAGYETIVDTNPGTFRASFPASQVAFYAGWYDQDVSGPFALPNAEFMPGAFAYHLHSFSAATLRSTKRQWAGPLLADGATATMGCVAEPYLSFTPNIGVFFDRFIRYDFSFGEAAYACQNAVSWQTTVVGDPLYRPFRRGPEALREDLLRRHNPLVEWTYLLMVNVNLLRGVPAQKLITYLENLDETARSPVLEEKLAQMYLNEGKPSSSVYALQQALKLDVTPLERTRLMLALADQLMALQRDAEAYEVFQEFAQDFPAYSDEDDIYRQLIHLADKLGKKADAENYQQKLSQFGH
jgi:uncharacterized protein (TIGR03790 family)